MPEIKDQNPEPDYETQKKINDEDLKEIDSILIEEAPDFMKGVSEIQIQTTEIELSVMEKAFRTASQKKTQFIFGVKRLFLFKQNPKAVMTFWLSWLTAVSLVYLSWSGRITFQDSKLFMTSLADLSSEPIQTVSQLADMESFYDNPRFAKNLMTMSKMFVNLKPSENSGPNPMLAFDINVEGISADAIVEIKDREAEFKDLLLRIVEDKTYDELVTPEGKQSLCDQFRQIINSYLTRGSVRRVLLNSFIIKP